MKENLNSITKKKSSNYQKKGNSGGIEEQKYYKTYRK